MYSVDDAFGSCKSVLRPLMFAVNISVYVVSLISDISSDNAFASMRPVTLTEISAQKVKIKLWSRMITC